MTCCLRLNDAVEYGLAREASAKGLDSTNAIWPKVELRGRNTPRAMRKISDEEKGLRNMRFKYITLINGGYHYNWASASWLGRYGNFTEKPARHRHKRLEQPEAPALGRLRLSAAILLPRVHVRYESMTITLTD